MAAEEEEVGRARVKMSVLPKVSMLYKAIILFCIMQVLAISTIINTTWIILFL
jgi:hypothetical protein